MRLAQVGLGSGVGLSGILRMNIDSWSGPRPILPLPETPDNYRNLQPLVRLRNRFYKKTPLQQHPEEKGERNLLQTSAPASTLSLQSTLHPPACCSRGQVEVTSPIHTMFSNRTPMCQSL